MRICEFRIDCNSTLKQADAAWYSRLAIEFVNQFSPLQEICVGLRVFRELWRGQYRVGKTEDLRKLC